MKTGNLRQSPPNSRPCNCNAITGGYKNTISLESCLPTARGTAEVCCLPKLRLTRFCCWTTSKVSTNSQEPGPAEVEFWHLPVAKDRLLPTAAEDQKGQCSGKRHSLPWCYRACKTAFFLWHYRCQQVPTQVSILSSFSYQQIYFQLPFLKGQVWASSHFCPNQTNNPLEAQISCPESLPSLLANLSHGKEVMIQMTAELPMHPWDTAPGHHPDKL